MLMSKELNKVINKTNEELEQEKQLVIEAPPSPPPITSVTPPVIPSNVEGAIVPFEPNWDDEPDFDLMQMVSDLEDGMLAQIQPPKTNTNNSTKSQNLLQQRNSPMFSGCKIGNITINIQKH